MPERRLGSSIPLYTEYFSDDCSDLLSNEGCGLRWKGCVLADGAGCRKGRRTKLDRTNVVGISSWIKGAVSMIEDMLGDDIGDGFDGSLEEMMGLWTARHSLALRG